MDYVEKIDQIKDKYFNELLTRYRDAAMAAATAGKKIPLFRKADFSSHIKAFEEIREGAESCLADLKQVEVPEDDEAYSEIAKLLGVSLEDFVELQKRNADHYDLMDKRQYRKNGITIDDFKLSLAGVQTGTGTAVESLDLLDRTYRYYHGEEVDMGGEEEPEETEDDLLEGGEV